MTSEGTTHTLCLGITVGKALTHKIKNNKS